MKRLYILLLIVLLVSLAACGKTTEVPAAQTVSEDAPTPQPTLAQKVVLPVMGGGAESVEGVTESPVAMPVSPVAQKVELGESDAMDTAKLDDAAAALVALVQQDLLKRETALSAGDIQVMNVAAQQWRNSSLGCPREGMMYAQVITPGYLIEVKAGGKVYEYHTDMNQSVVLCAVDGAKVE